MPYSDIIVAGELKHDARKIEQGLGQAFAYKQFAHKSYLALPAAATAQVERAEELCVRAQVGLCVFETATPSAPDFRLRVRAVAGTPDMQVLNDKLLVLRNELW